MQNNIKNSNYVYEISHASNLYKVPLKIITKNQTCYIFIQEKLLHTLNFFSPNTPLKNEVDYLQS